ncbi:hypothetical protein SAMN04488008_101620 [Maribacter orientalis]|uniref:LVIVD repeat-containing protein n=1 Tax=Maribacter orientalis TaxID=228957 RepID=A0A1H7HM51_9FLAO|nr:hypothetical protein [Maribacter orientalis]SEK51473.1 hypothetical protein SAMN04488008_101620 [Maribacter orientalis]
MNSNLSIRKVWSIAISVTFLVASCSDETTIFENPEDNLVKETNQLKLDNSVSFERAGVLDIYEDPISSAKRYNATGKAEQAGDYPLTLVAQIAPPSFENGENLTATHVALNGDYGYVSYNTVGQDYVGAVDVIDISDPNNPRVTSRVYFTNADLNSIAYDAGYVYAAGGVDSEKSVTATANSVVVKIAVSGGRLNTSDITFGFQEGFNATDVSIMNNNVIATSGQDGFVVIYDKNDMSILNEASFADLRSVAYNGNEIAVLDAAQGVSFLDQSLNVTRTIGIESDFGIDAKRTLDFSNDNIVVAEGSKGAGIYNANSGSFVEYLPILTSPENAEQGDIVTNGVAVNENVLLMANGAGGLSLNENTTDNTQGVGVIELTGSINYVASKGDYIFAASGKSGFQIIKLNRPTQSLVSSCENLASFNGDSRYSVPAGEEQAYSGSKRFNSLTVEGTLLLCGSWTVKDDITINENGVFEMNGTIVVGRTNRSRDIVVKAGATLRIEGSVSIYGDLILEDGATVEFLGDSTIAVIWGSVVKAGSATVTGTFNDYFNKF